MCYIIYCHNKKGKVNEKIQRDVNTESKAEY